MTRRLPPLNQLRAFEAAARLGSFKAAGDELNVTHTAISHQVKALEEYFGFPLFHRETRKVVLTENATRLAIEIGTSLDMLDGAAKNFLHAYTDRPLVLSVAPIYGNRFLLPAMKEFRARHPDIQIQVRLDYEKIDFRTSEVDAGIRFGMGDWPGLEAMRLHDEVYVPLAAPSLVQGINLPISMDDLARLPLAADPLTGNLWPGWFEQAGMTPPGNLDYCHFDNSGLVFDFGLAGNGAILWDARILKSELDKGALVQLHPASMARDVSVYLVYPDQNEPDPRLLVFRDWLRSFVEQVQRP